MAELNLWLFQSFLYAGLELAFLFRICSCSMALRFNDLNACLLIGLTFLGEVPIGCSKLDGCDVIEPWDSSSWLGLLSSWLAFKSQGDEV